MRHRIFRIAIIASTAVVYLSFYPLLLIGMVHPSFEHFARLVERLIIKGILGVLGLPVIKYYESQLEDQPYIFCANHASILDIAVFFCHTYPLVILGKTSLTRIPLFGFVYNRLHVLVDRAALRKTHLLLDECKAAMAKNYGIVIFPEGGIVSTFPPQLAPFKSGAFRLAIETQVPVVPVSIYTNWTIWPKYLRAGMPLIPKIEIRFHRPIETKNMTLADTKELSNQTRACILGAMRQRWGTIMDKP